MILDAKIERGDLQYLHLTFHFPFFISGSRKSSQTFDLFGLLKSWQGFSTLASFDVVIGVGSLVSKLRRTYTYIMEGQLAVSFSKAVDRKRKHPGEEASGHLGTSGRRHPG